MVFPHGFPMPINNQLHRYSVAQCVSQDLLQQFFWTGPGGADQCLFMTCFDNYVQCLFRLMPLQGVSSNVLQYVWRAHVLLLDMPRAFQFYRQALFASFRYSFSIRLRVKSRRTSMMSDLLASVWSLKHFLACAISSLACDCFVAIHYPADSRSGREQVGKQHLVGSRSKAHHPAKTSVVQFLYQELSKCC